MSKPLIIDAFPFANEKLVLEIRLNELSELVDHFIIIESNKTQTGIDKPYYFESYKEDFEKFSSKIVYIKLDDSSLTSVDKGNWSQEFRVRKAIVEVGLPELSKKVKLKDEDYLIFSDCDEIPKLEVLRKFAKNKEEVICFNHYFNSYFLNMHSKFRNPWGWYGAIMLKLKYLYTNDIQLLRNVKDKLPHSGDSGEGWHFSNMLLDEFESIYSKWVNNIEPHDKSCLRDKILLKSQFEKCLHEDSHFFFCDQPEKREIFLEKLPECDLPLYVTNNAYKFKKLLIH